MKLSKKDKEALQNRIRKFYDIVTEMIEMDFYTNNDFDEMIKSLDDAILQTNICIIAYKKSK